MKVRWIDWLVEKQLKSLCALVYLRCMKVKQKAVIDKENCGVD